MCAICLCVDTVYVLISLDWFEPMMQFVLHITYSCISHAYVLSFQYTCYIELLGTFLIVFLSLPLFLFTLVVSMASKRKSTPSRNPLHFGASSFFDPTPSHLWFRDEDARNDFLENFSQRGVHSERRVILANFTNTNLPTVIHSQG